MSYKRKRLKEMMSSDKDSSNNIRKALNSSERQRGRKIVQEQRIEYENDIFDYDTNCHCGACVHSFSEVLVAIFKVLGLRVLQPANHNNPDYFIDILEHLDKTHHNPEHWH